jgi:hypothetical protein
VCISECCVCGGNIGDEASQCPGTVGQDFTVSGSKNKVE